MKYILSLVRVDSLFPHCSLESSGTSTAVPVVGIRMIVLRPSSGPIAAFEQIDSKSRMTTGTYRQTEHYSTSSETDGGRTKILLQHPPPTRTTTSGEEETLIFHSVTIQTQRIMMHFMLTAASVPSALRWSHETEQ